MCSPPVSFGNQPGSWAGPIDENLHIALDLDLWLRMAKKGCKFVGIPDLLSTALSHQSAKTMAFEDFMIVDAAIVILRRGGEDAAVREWLEDIARRLSWYEPNLKKIINNPLFKILSPMIKLFFKPAVRWRETAPPWSNNHPRIFRDKVNESNGLFRM